SAKEKIKQLKYFLNKPVNYKSDFSLANGLPLSFDENEFFEKVEMSKCNIAAGDIFQLVLSKKFSADFTGDMLNVYRSLRIINPSPYMYYLEFGDDLKIAGTSPEDLIKVKNRK